MQAGGSGRSQLRILQASRKGSARVHVVTCLGLCSLLSSRTPRRSPSCPRSWKFVGASSTQLPRIWTAFGMTVRLPSSNMLGPSHGVSISKIQRCRRGCRRSRTRRKPRSPALSDEKQHAVRPTPAPRFAKQISVHANTMKKHYMDLEKVQADIASTRDSRPEKCQQGDLEATPTCITLP